MTNLAVTTRPLCPFPYFPLRLATLIFAPKMKRFMMPTSLSLSKTTLGLALALITLAPLTTFAQDAVAQGEALIQSAVTAHGGTAYETAHYKFVFRDKAYTFHNNKDLYTYTRTISKDGQTIVDKMDNQGFSRTIDGTTAVLTEKQSSGNREGVNSVIYFATLPYKLLDKAVNAKYVGEQEIKGKTYSLVQVTFDQEGGGKDYDDVFIYWINKATHTMDYLAYSYHVNGGGVRFRSAYNTRKVGGILFQDYINYKADKTTPLDQLPALYEANKLKELSRIDTEDVQLLH